MSRPPTARDYATLGLRPGAADDEVRAAYRRLAKIHHPDRNPGDPQAVDTFRRITDSYVAVRDGARRAAGPARRRTPVRRGATGSGSRIVDLLMAGALWVDAGALLVAPDRSIALRPDASGTAYPTDARVIRVERRPEGLHVFMPPQPSARWGVGAAAETDGLAVAALWVGERQTGDDRRAGPRLPLRLLRGTIEEMADGDRGWTSAEALSVDGEGAWTLDTRHPVSPLPHRSTRLRVLRDSDGFRVHGDDPASAWSPAEVAAGPDRVAVRAVILAGTEYGPPAGPT